MKLEQTDRQTTTMCHKPVTGNFKAIEQLTAVEKEAYYNALRAKCAKINAQSGRPLSARLIAAVSPMLRHFKLEIRGTENLPQDGAAVFVCNHSNSHDIFLAIEVFAKLRRGVSVLVAWDGLSLFSRLAFHMGNVTFIERSGAKSKQDGVSTLCSKVMKGTDAFVFGEATWNLHPILPMQRVKAGAVQIALITERPIIPVIFEYIEVPELCKKESELYEKCVICFGKTIKVNQKENIFHQTDEIQRKMEAMRKELWKEFGIQRECLEDVNQELYLNHLYVKKFRAFGFMYDSAHESQFLLSKENEYHRNKAGKFVPGILKNHDL